MVSINNSDFKKPKEFSLAAVQKHPKENALSQSHLLRFSRRVSCSPITERKGSFLEYHVCTLKCLVIKVYIYTITMSKTS